MLSLSQYRFEVASRFQTANFCSQSKLVATGVILERGVTPCKVAMKYSTRRPATTGIFFPSISLKMPFEIERLKTFLFSKNTLHIFSNFSKSEKFLIFFHKKTSRLRCKTLLRSNIICYGIYSKFATFTDFERK